MIVTMVTGGEWSQVSGYNLEGTGEFWHAPQATGVTAAPMT